LTCS